MPTAIILAGHSRWHVDDSRRATTELDIDDAGNPAGDGDERASRECRKLWRGQTLSVPSAPALQSQFDTGTSSSDQLTNLTSVGFLVTGVQAGATVQLLDTSNGNAVIGSAIASGSSVSVTNSIPLSEGTHSIVAVQTLAGFASAQSAAGSVTIDTTPPQITSGTLPSATVGTPYTFTVTSDDSQAQFQPRVDARWGADRSYVGRADLGADQRGSRFSTSHCRGNRRRRQHVAEDACRGRGGAAIVWSHRGPIREPG